MATLPLSPDELLTTTRTVRKRLDLDRPVPMDLVRECIEIALQAPSGSNRQGWQWLVVIDPDLRRRIGEVYREVTEAYLASQGSAARLFADDPQRAPVQRRVGDSVAHLQREAEVADLLGLPAGVHQGALVPTAFYTGETFAPAHRVPLDTVLHIDGW